MKQNQFKFKPFDKVVVRNSESNIWKVDFFSHLNNEKYCVPYNCVSGGWEQCVPYNEETAHLIGTCKPYEPKIWTVKTEEDQPQSYTHDEFLKLIENIKKDKSECVFIFGYTGIENSN